MFKRAERKGAKFAIIIGEDEVSKQQVVIKNLETTEQKSCELDKLIETISTEMGEEFCD
jgi:histidyl-tRNA synthetase